MIASPPDDPSPVRPVPAFAAATRWAVAVMLCALLFAMAYWMSRPQRLSGFIVDRIAHSLGLEISAKGASEYRLRGTPRLVLRDVIVRQHGDVELLRADRIDISLPWSTLRARGADLTLRRVELDRPQLDVPALQRWLATRPPSEGRTPTLIDGLRIRDGSIVNDDWRIDAIAVDVPTLRPGKRLRARIRGRYNDPSTAIPFDLAVALAQVDSDTGLAVVGTLTLQRKDWRMPARLSLSGPLHLGRDSLRMSPAHLAVSARYRDEALDLPFALGLHGPLHFDAATWAFAPAGVALRGAGVIPDLDAHGGLALGHRLVLRLQGRLRGWPDAWPALPPPIGTSSSPLPFVLDYAGNASFDDVIATRVSRDTTTFDGSFRLPEVLAWIEAPDASPVPPLQGRLRAATLEISGARLDGVEVRIDDAEPASP